MGGIIFSIILLIIFSIFLNNSLRMEDLREVDPIGASGFPTVALSLIILLLLISIVKEVIKYTKNKKNHDEKQQTKGSVFTIILLMISLILFVLVLDKVGFLLSSFLLTPILLLTLGERKVVKITTLTILTPLVFTVLFGNLLSIPLPRGMGIFSELSRFIY